MKKQAVPDGHGSRRHKCDQCGEVYVCEECTFAMIDAQGTADFSRLYSANHVPQLFNGTPWLCPGCEKTETLPKKELTTRAT